MFVCLVFVVVVVVVVVVDDDIFLIWLAGIDRDTFKKMLIILFLSVY